MNKSIAITTAALTALSSASLAGEQGGGDIVLSDANSSASFNSDGQFSWTVGGVDHLYAQEFYFRRDGFNDEVNLNSLTLLGQAVNDTNPFSDDNFDSLSSLFTDGNGLEIETIFTLRGGTAGSGESAIAEQISFTNTGTSTMSFTFFQYVDFDLGESSGDDTGSIVGGNVAQQSDDSGFSLSETVATPIPTAFQMGDEGDISALWSNGVIDNLNGDDSYSGDVAWAFQWDITLEAGDSFLISKNKAIVPAPGSLLLLGASGLIAGRRRRS